MKKKLLDKLKEIFPDVLKKLTPKGQEVLAEKLSAKITEESEIEDFVNGLENVIDVFVDTMVSETDRRVKEAVDKARKPKPTSKDEPEDEDKDTPKDDAPQWAQDMLSEFKTLKAQISADKQKTKLTTFIETAKAKGITLTEKMAKGYVDAEDFDEETALSELAEHYKIEDQYNANAGVGNGQVIRGVPRKTGEVKEATKEELDAVSANLKF